MEPGDDGVELSVRAYLTAARDRDYNALWRLMSRGAQAIVVASANAEGLATDNGPAALHALMSVQAADQPGPDDVVIEVVNRYENVAQVTLSSASRREAETLPFVYEDGDWKLGVQGLHAREA